MCQKAPQEGKVYPDFEKLWDYSKPQKTEENFRALLPDAKEKGDSYYGQLLTQIARAEGLPGKIDEVHETLDTVETLITDDLVVVDIRYLLERGEYTIRRSCRRRLARFSWKLWHWQRNMERISMQSMRYI